MERKFSVLQEVVRKYVEHCFGVVQERFRVLRLKSHFWKKDTLGFFSRMNQRGVRNIAQYDCMHAKERATTSG